MGVADNKSLRWNDDPTWVEYTYTFEQVIQQITNKYCSDVSMRPDCHQEARIALLTIYPHNVNGYSEYILGNIGEEEWGIRVDKYCRNVIRNTILSFLDSLKTGNWYVGRTRRTLNKYTGEKEKQYIPPRYSSLNELVDVHGMEVDEDGNISWPEVSTDGLDIER